MIYTIQKQNLGSPRTYSTQGRLATALYKAGAHHVGFETGGAIVVTWKEGKVTYPVDKAGNVDHQLAWDMETK